MLIAFGAGIIVAALLMQMSYYSTLRFQVEREAKKMGMIYPTEQKVLNEEDYSND